MRIGSSGTGGTTSASSRRKVGRLSPIAITAVVAAGVAVAVVVALQNEDPGRLSVQDALATRFAGSDDALLTMTFVNDGGDDRVVGLVIPIARSVRLVHANAADGEAGSASTDAISLITPARESLTLDADHTYILAGGVDWTALVDGRIPLSIRLERSDAITVFVEVDTAD